MAKRDLHETSNPPDRFIRAAEARRRFGAGVCHSTWWKWAQRPEFPRRYRLGPNTVGWSERELEAYFASQRETDPASRYSRSIPRPGRLSKAKADSLTTAGA